MIPTTLSSCSCTWIRRRWAFQKSEFEHRKSSQIEHSLREHERCRLRRLQCKSARWTTKWSLGESRNRNRRNHSAGRALRMRRSSRCACFAKDRYKERSNAYDFEHLDPAMENETLPGLPVAKIDLKDATNFDVDGGDSVYFNFLPVTRRLRRGRHSSRQVVRI